MSISLRKMSLAILASALLSSTAHAGIFDFDPAPGGAYVSGFVGGAFPFDANFDGTQDPAAGVPGVAGADADIDAEFDTDVVFGGAVGVKLPFRYWKYFQPRLELEVSHFEADVDEGDFNGGDQTFSGDQSLTFYLINNVSDFQWTDNQRVIPYFGGGIGVATVDTDIQYFPNNGVATAPTFAAQGDDTAFATVSNIGLTFKATDKFDIYTEARYYKLYGVDAERTFIGDGGEGFNADVDDDTDGFTLTVGARINF
ncbi:MAG: hypothetical protein ABJG88_11810 [Litorimonas sp.]